jgi:hypothetical protein
VSLPWFRARTPGILAGMMRQKWTLENPCPEYVAELELSAIIASDQRDDWSIRDLASQWGWPRATTHRWVRKTETRLVKCWDNTHLESQALTSDDETEVGRKWDASRTQLNTRKKEKKKKKKTSMSGKKPDRSSSGKAQEVYDHWRGYHPRASERLTSDRRTMLNARIRESGVEACKLVTRWVHEAPGASFYRGENDRNTVYTGVGTLFKARRWGDRVDKAQEWADCGYQLEHQSFKEAEKQKKDDEFDRYLRGELDSTPITHSNVVRLDLGENR